MNYNLLISQTLLNAFTWYMISKNCQYITSGSSTALPVGNVLLVTGWLILSSAYKSWDSTVKLINCSMGYHNVLSGLICRAFSQAPSYMFRKKHLIFTTRHCQVLPLVDFLDLLMTNADQCRSMPININWYLCWSMRIIADQYQSMPNSAGSILLDPALIGIDLHWSEFGSMPKFWSALIDVNRHWELIEGVLNILQYSQTFFTRRQYCSQHIVEIYLKCSKWVGKWVVFEWCPVGVSKTLSET